MKQGILALSPLAVFLGVYVVASVLAGDFYKVPISVAFLFTSIYAVATAKGLSLAERITFFSEGAGHPSMMLMIWIFILAGAFAKCAEAMGAIDATVHLALQILPSNFLLPSLFLAACFISLSIGTSVGTIVALTPMASGIAVATGASTPLLVGVVVGGAFFGDNLSFISDTTIMATRTQGCRMNDKFRVNSRIVIPAAVIVLLYYIVAGTHIHAPSHLPDVDVLKVIPYLVVLTAAAAGIDVLIVLTAGILLSGIIGICHGSFDLYGCFQAMGNGILGMSELIIITMMAGGLMALIRHGGGIDFIITHLTRHINGRRGAEFTIGGLVVFTNLCTANNTVAILTVGPIARDIASRFGVEPRKSASLLDTFSCLAQSVIPYGAQLLMAGGLAAINPVSIIPYLYYPFCMGACVVISILTDKGKPKAPHEHFQEAL